MADDFDWKWEFAVPWPKDRQEALLSSLLMFLRRQEEEIGLRFEIRESPDSPERMLVGVRGPILSSRVRSFLDVLAIDLGVLVNNVIVPPKPPKSVWQWIRASKKDDYS